MNVLLGFLLGVSVGITLAMLVSVFMFAKYKRKNDQADVQLHVLHQRQIDRLSTNARILAGMIYDHITGFIPSIHHSLSGGSFPTQQLVTLSTFLSWMYYLDTLGEEAGDKSHALSRIQKFVSLAGETIEEFSIEVHDLGFSRRFSFSWKGIKHKFTTAPR